MADVMPPAEGGEVEEEPGDFSLQSFIDKVKQSEVFRNLMDWMKELQRMIQNDTLAGVGLIMLLVVVSVPILIYLLFVVGSLLVGVTGFLCVEGILVGIATCFLLTSLFFIMLGATGIMVFIVAFFGFIKYLVEGGRKINSFFNPWNTRRRVPAVETVSNRKCHGE